jgi:hypothetical protein
MIRPMNEQEITLGARCDVCSDLATHCGSEMTDFPLFLCTGHAFEQAIIHGGTVRPRISATPDSEVTTEGMAASASSPHRVPTVDEVFAVKR